MQRYYFFFLESINQAIIVVIQVDPQFLEVVILSVNSHTDLNQEDLDLSREYLISGRQVFTLVSFLSCHSSLSHDTMSGLRATFQFLSPASHPFSFANK